MDTEEPIEDILLWFFEFKMLYFWPKMFVFDIKMAILVKKKMTISATEFRAFICVKIFQKCEFS